MFPSCGASGPRCQLLNITVLMKFGKKKSNGNKIKISNANEVKIAEQIPTGKFIENPLKLTLILESN